MEFVKQSFIRHSSGMIARNDIYIASNGNLFGMLTPIMKEGYNEKIL